MGNESSVSESMRKQRVQAWCAVAAILVVFCAARAVTFRGFAASDDANVAELANRIVRGEFPPSANGIPPHYPFRLGVIVPVAVLFRVFGVSEATLLVVPVLASLGMMALAFCAGRLFFSTRAGLIGAGIFALMPIDCRFATWLLSDTPAAFWAAAGVLLLYGGSKARAGRAKAGFGVGAGLCLGLSWITRAQVVHLAPFVAGLLIVWTVRDRKNLWLAVPAAGCVIVLFLGECAFYAATRGDWLARFHAFERMYEMHTHWYFTEGAMYGWPEGRYVFGLFRRWFKQGPTALFFKHNFAWVQAVALVAGTFAWRKRLRPFAFPAAWFAWTCLMFNFGSNSLRHYQPLPWIDSYLMPTLFPAVLVVAGWLDFMLARPESADAALGGERRFWAGWAIAVLLAGSAYGNLQHVRQGVGCPVARRAAKTIAPHELIYTDSSTSRALRFFWGYPADAATREFMEAPKKEPLRKVKVFVNPRQLRRQQDIIGYQPPAWVASPPRHWRRVHEFQGGGVLYETPP